MNKRLTLFYKMIFLIAILFLVLQLREMRGLAEKPTEAQTLHIPPVKNQYSVEHAEDSALHIPPEAIEIQFLYILLKEKIKPIDPLEEMKSTSEAVELGEFTVTAYCPCEKCCGKWAIDRPGGVVYTASGAIAQEGVTIAVDPKVIPYGTELYIDGYGTRIAQDCGGAIKGNKLDLYFDDHAAALEFGRQTLNVWIVETLTSNTGMIK